MELVPHMDVQRWSAADEHCALTQATYFISERSYSHWRSLKSVERFMGLARCCMRIHANDYSMSIGFRMEDKDEVLLSISIGQLSGVRRQQLIDATLESGTFMSVADSISSGQRRCASDIAQECEKQGISVVPLSSPRYPGLLRKTSSPPPVIYVRSREALCEPLGACLSVVGTRSASVEVCQVASDIACDLVTAGFTVVSGLALGIDGAAHRGALAASLPIPTVGVLAHGLDTLYPSSHISLAKEIIGRGGLLISDYPPGVQPLKHHFLARNRIIAGLSQGVVVVQAGARSGSLVTAQFAADYGRDVFILASAEMDERWQGGKAMLDEGAIPIASAVDVLREYNLIGESDREYEARSEWNILTVDEFMARDHLSGADLLRLEIAGEVMRMPGNRIRVRSAFGAGDT